MLCRGVPSARIVHCRGLANLSKGGKRWSALGRREERVDSPKGHSSIKTTTKVVTLQKIRPVLAYSAIL